MKIYNSGLDTIGKVIIAYQTCGLIFNFNQAFLTVSIILMTLLVGYSIYVRYAVNQAKSEHFFFERKGDFLQARGIPIVMITLLFDVLYHDKKIDFSEMNISHAIILSLLLLYSFLVIPKGIIRKTKNEIFISGIKRTLLLSDIKTIDVEQTKITFHLHSHDVKLEGCNLLEEEIIRLRNFLENSETV
ncbi:MAG: hypothetical protein RL204_681 [Bacteroidota bacterium]|jgi:hypothetical protein